SLQSDRWRDARSTGRKNRIKAVIPTPNDVNKVTSYSTVWEKKSHTVKPRSGYAQNVQAVYRSKCLKNRAQRLNILNGLTSSTFRCPLPAIEDACSSVAVHRE